MEEIINATFTSGEQFELVRKRTCRREHVPAYDRIGGNMDYRSPVQGYENLYKTFGKLSKKANWFLWELVEARNSATNISYYAASTPTESKNIAIAYKELEEKELIYRVSRQHYLLNPMAFIPKPGLYDEILAQWEARNAS